MSNPTRSISFSPRIVRQLHRWLGLAFALAALTSAGSGVLHNVMTRTQSPPPPVRPSGAGLELASVRVSPADAAKALPAAMAQKAVSAVNLRSIGGEPWWQFFVSGAPGVQYVNASSGTLDPTQDERYAAEIASSHLGGAKVQRKAYLTAFDAEYIAIFRVLPVYRFDAGDAAASRVYVSTVTGSVTRFTDHRRQWEADVFSNLHKLAFIPNKDVRDFVLTTLTAGVFLASLLGLILFFQTARPK